MNSLDTAYKMVYHFRKSRICQFFDGRRQQFGGRGIGGVPMTSKPTAGREPDERRLLGLAKDGDRQAEDRLVAGYEGVIRARASQFHVSGLEAEDLIQEGMIGFIGAIRHFDTSKGASFRTYASLCITSRILSAVRSALRKKQQPLNGYVPLDDTAAVAQAARSSAVDPEAMVLVREAVSAANDTIINCFSPIERRIFACYLAGCSYADIARKLGVGKKYVDNALQRMKKKLSLNAAV